MWGSAQASALQLTRTRGTGRDRAAAAGAGQAGAGQGPAVLRIAGPPRASGACCGDGEAARAAPHRSLLWTVVVARHSGFDFLRALEDSLQLFRSETLLVECKPLRLTFTAL